MKAELDEFVFRVKHHTYVHENIKKAMVENDERATDLLFRSYKNTARVARNSAMGGFDKPLDVGQRAIAVDVEDAEVASVRFGDTSKLS